MKALNLNNSELCVTYTRVCVKVKSLRGKIIGCPGRRLDSGVITVALSLHAARKSEKKTKRQEVFRFYICLTVSHNHVFVILTKPCGGKQY